MRFHVLIDNFNININTSAVWNQYCLNQYSNVESAVWHRIMVRQKLYLGYFFY